MPESSDVGSGPWLVDGHVHIHPEFDRRTLFDAAAHNFRRAAEHLELHGDTPGVLMLTESAGAHAFEELRADPAAVAGWSIEATAEPVSLRLAGERATLYVIAGRQVITAERLEVLALGTREPVPDGLPLAAAVGRVRADGALPVLPWGFGKWTGTRGRVVASFIASAESEGTLLGDNGGRPAVARTPDLLAEAERGGRPIVPGTDPLPLRSQVGRAGSFGFVLDGPADPAHPCRTVLDFLTRLTVQPRRFGRLMPVGGFVLAQLGMQIQARARRSGARFTP